jgi:hypothetical protein
MPDYVNIVGLVAWQVQQAAIALTSVQIATPALAGRKTISIKALAANTSTIYIGPNSGVTSSNGYELAAGDTIDMEIDNTNAIWCIGAAIGQRVCWAEVA